MQLKKRKEKIKNLPMKTSVELSSKGEATFVSDLLLQRLAFRASVCNISFDDCKELILFLMQL